MYENQKLPVEIKRLGKSVDISGASVCCSLYDNDLRFIDSN